MAPRDETDWWTEQPYRGDPLEAPPKNDRGELLCPGCGLTLVDAKHPFTLSAVWTCCTYRMKYDYVGSFERYIRIEHRDQPSTIVPMKLHAGQPYALEQLFAAIQLNLEMEIEGAKQNYGKVERGAESYIPNLLERLELGDRILPHEVGVSVLIDKSRRQGISMLAKAIMAVQCSSLEARACLLMAHNEETAQEELGRDLKRVLEAWPPDWIQMRQKFSASLSQFLFENGSRISIKTAGNVKDREASRGWKFDFYHYSEYAHYNTYADARAAELVRPKHAWVLKESTANGKGNPFYVEWMQGMFVAEARAVWEARNEDPIARERLRAWGVPKHQYRIFLSWLDDPACVSTVYDFEADEYTDEKLDDTERAIRAKHPGRFTPERIKWRRATVKAAQNHPSLDPEAYVAQEYPTDWEDSFQDTGESLFNPSALDMMEAHQKKPENHPILKFKVDGKQTPKLARHGGANAFIYRMPQPGRSYVIGADAAWAGTGRNRRDAKKDFHFLTVWDQHDGTFFEEVAAFWRRDIDAYEFGHIVTFFAELYYEAFVTPEIQMGGLALCTALVKMNNYPRVYRRMTLDSVSATGDANISRFGIHSSEQVKDLYIQHASMLIGDKDENGRLAPRVLIRTPEILRQFRMYKRHDDGTLGAPVGDHDDGVSSSTIAWWGAKQAPPNERYDTRRSEQAEKQYETTDITPDMARIHAAVQAKVKKDRARTKKYATTGGAKR